LDIGTRLIDCAGEIESFLFAERLSQPDEIRSLQELENTVGNGEKIDWFVGARQIFGKNLKNRTDASKKLKEFLEWCRSYTNPPEKSAARRFLTEAINGLENRTKPKIPSALISLFKERHYFELFKMERSWTQRSRKKRNPAKSA
jgi:hypothetical protein